MISVVVLNFNGKQFLEACLKSLSSQTYNDFEVIVVDNGSADGSVSYLEDSFPNIRVIATGRNLGFAGGINAGIAHAQGEYVLTLNNDTRSDKRLLENLADAMDSNSNVGSCATKMLLSDGRINSTGVCISRSGAAWDRGMFEADHGQYDRVEEVFGPCAGAALYRKKMLDEIGLFDEDFFLYMEDVDLAFRARLAGWMCKYVPEAIVYHLHGGTAGVGSDLAVYYVNRNILWYALKDFPLKLLITQLPWIVGRNLAVIPYYALKGQGRVILKSKLDGVMGLPLMQKKRNKVVRKDEREIRRQMRTWATINRPHERRR